MSAETHEETVEVVIQATGRVEYCQTVKMPKSVFEKLDRMLDSDHRKERENAEEEIQGWVNPADILDADLFELEDFHLADPAGQREA